MQYAKIDRATSAIIARKNYENPQRVFNKPQVWLPYIDPGAPAYDPLAADLTRVEVIPDLSDMGVDVPGDAVVDVQYTVTPLSPAEIDSRAETKAQSAFDNTKMVKAVAIWTAQKLGIPLATARGEIKAIYRGL